MTDTPTGQGPATTQDTPLTRAGIDGIFMDTEGSVDILSTGHFQVLTNDDVVITASNQLEAIFEGGTLNFVDFTAPTKITNLNTFEHDVTGNYTLNARAMLLETVTGNWTETALANRTQTTTGNLTETINGAHTWTVVGATTFTHAGEKMTLSGGNFVQTAASAKFDIKAAFGMELSASLNLALKLAASIEVFLGPKIDTGTGLRMGAVHGLHVDLNSGLKFEGKLTTDLEAATMSVKMKALHIFL